MFIKRHRIEWGKNKIPVLANAHTQRQNSFTLSPAGSVITSQLKTTSHKSLLVPLSGQALLAPKSRPRTKSWRWSPLTSSSSPSHRKVGVGAVSRARLRTTPEWRRVAIGLEGGRAPSSQEVTTNRTSQNRGERPCTLTPDINTHTYARKNTLMANETFSRHKTRKRS